MRTDIIISSRRTSRARPAGLAVPAVALSALVLALALAAPGVAGPTSPAATPRMADGHPDLNGTWDNGSGIDFLHPQHLAGGSVCVAGCEAPPGAARATRTAGQSAGTAGPPRGGRPAANFPAYRAQYLSHVHELDAQQLARDPVLHCGPPGLPRIGPPDKIVQIPGQVVFLYDDVSGAFWRIIPTDGRAHRTDVEASSLGDSVGHWEGDTLVIDANQFDDQTWLTDNGAFHTADMRVTERLRRVGDTLHWEAVVEDPKVLERPWKATPRVARLTDQELVEPTTCVDRDLKHVVDNTHHNNPR